MASAQGPNPWTDAEPDYFSFATIWDGNWYHIVSAVGYPDRLPMTDGHVTENAWAFMPGYPSTVSGLMELTGVPWAPMAVFMSLAFGLGTALVFFALMRLALDEGTALFSVVLLCVAPVSPLMQLAYAESMQQFFLILGLYLLVKRRYMLLLPVVFVFALTRPAGLAFALAMVFHLIYRWARRRRDPFPVHERLAASSAAVFSALMGVAWPVIAWMGTGSMTAYVDTELSWRSDYIGYQALSAFTAWFKAGGWWLGQPLGAMVVVALIVAFALVLLSRPVRRLGVDVRFWLLSYALYLLAVFFPQSSTFRLLMPMSPLLGALAQPKPLAYRLGLVMFSIAGQLGWLLLCWGVDGSDWSPP